MHLEAAGVPLKLTSLYDSYPGQRWAFVLKSHLEQKGRIKEIMAFKLRVSKPEGGLILLVFISWSTFLTLL